MRFTADSGLAQWARDNMQVRYEQAVHIREGEPSSEEPVNEVSEDGEHRLFRCDLPLMDELHAIDAFNTLTDANVLGQATAIPDSDGDMPSWVELHECDHADDVRSGCVVSARESNP